MRARSLLSFLLVLSASPTLGAGVDIAWDNCLGETGAVSAKQFACNSNLGTESLWISFESPVSAAAMATVEVAIEFRTKSGNPLPVWWDFEDLASCRRGQLFVDTAAPFETPTCARLFTSLDPPVWVSDRIDYQFPTTDMGRMIVACHPAGPLVANQRYLACRLVLTHFKSIGCAGCGDPVTVTVTAVRVDGVIMSNPIQNNVALWQQNLPTATRAFTWSAVKALYH